MSWIQAVQTAVLPLFEADPPAPLAPKRAKSSSRTKSSPRVTTRAGVSVSSSGKKSARGGVKVRSGPSTSSLSVKLDEKGRLSGQLGQGYELKLGAHTLVLGAAVDSDGDVKSQVTFKSPLLKKPKR